MAASNEKYTLIPKYRYKVTYRRNGHKRTTFVGFYIRRNVFGDLVFSVQPLRYTPIEVADKEIEVCHWSTDIIQVPYADSRKGVQRR